MARQLRASGYLGLVQSEKAIVDLSKAIELIPDEAIFHYWRALPQLGMGDTEGCRKSWATMVEKEFPQWTSWTCALVPYD